MIRQAVTAIIHLAKRGRSASGRYGKFLRPDKAPHALATDLHLWEGRELSVAEFNTLFPTALKSVLGTDTVFGQIIVREVEDAEGEGGAGDEALEKLKKEHEAAIEALKDAFKTEKAEAVSLSQDVVNAFTATHNANLELAKARIAELEALIPAAGEATKPEVVASEPAKETLSEESHGIPLVDEAAPLAAGEQPAVAAAPPPEVVIEAAPEPAKPKDKKKK